MRVRGAGGGRVSIAGVACYRPGDRPHLYYHLRVHRRRKGEPKGFTWSDYRDLIIAAHHNLSAPLVWCWDNLNIHLAPELADFAAENTEWLRVYRLPAYAPDLNPAEMSLPQCELRRSSSAAWLPGSLSFEVSIGVPVVGPAAPVVVAGRQLVQRAEAFDFGVVCGDDPPVGCPGVLPAGDPAAFEPSEQGRHWHPDLAGQGGQPPLAGPEAAVIGAVVVVQAGTQAQPADQVLDLAVMEAFVLAGCAEALGCELAGDRGVAQALPARALIRSVSAG